MSSPQSERVFAYESFVHPSQQPGHIAFVLRVLDPRMYEREPRAGLTLVTIAFAQYAMPTGFHNLPIDEQALLYLEITYPFWTLTSSLVLAEEKGLVLVSNEWRQRFGHYGQSIGETHEVILRENVFGNSNRDIGTPEAGTHDMESSLPAPISVPTASVQRAEMPVDDASSRPNSIESNGSDRSSRSETTEDRHNADQTGPNGHNREQ